MTDLETTPLLQPSGGNQEPSPGSSGLPVVALTAAGLYSAWAVLQAVLAAGAPLGEHVWGGRQDATLPPGMRVASGAGSVVLIWMATVILARADLTRIRPVPTGRLAAFTWAIAGYMALNTVGNLASQSTIEQRVFAPVTAVMTVLTVVIAHRGQRR